MGLFGRGQEKPPPSTMAYLQELRSLVENLSSEVRTLRLELSAQSDLVTKRMRRAVAAERAVERNQERPLAGTPVAVTPAPPPPPVVASGARARASRNARRVAPPPTGLHLSLPRTAPGPRTSPRRSDGTDPHALETWPGRAVRW